jgi:hypothetical protein
MKAIVLTDDQLRLLEKRFGPKVRQMGPWSSDGTFGYSNVPIATLAEAAENLQDPDLTAALTRLERTPERATLFIGLLETFGPPLIEKVVAAYRGGCREWTTLPAPLVPSSESRGISAKRAPLHGLSALTR